MDATLAPKGLRPQNPTKKLAHLVELLGQPLSQKNAFEYLGPEPPPAPHNKSRCAGCKYILYSIILHNIYLNSVVPLHLDLG